MREQREFDFMKVPEAKVFCIDFKNERSVFEFDSFKNAVAFLEKHAVKRPREFAYVSVYMLGRGKYIKMMEFESEFHDEKTVITFA